MRLRTWVDRADLLECLCVHGAARLEDLAEVLNYAPREREKVEKPPTAKLRSPEKEPNSNLPPPTAVVSPQLCFYRITAQRVLEADEVVRDEPDWFKQAESLQSEDEIRAPDGVSPPPQPPLMGWSRLWPFLKTVLGTHQTLHALDLPLVVNRLARVSPLRDLPHQRRQTWAADTQIIVDYAPPLLPFWTDFNRLLKRLRNLRGSWGLQIVAFPEGVPSDRCWISVGGEWQDGDHYPLPAPGAKILVLSDLGCIDKTDERRCQWRQLGLRLARAGFRPVALMPCPSRWWKSDLTRWFYPVCWDRTQRPPRHIGLRRAISSPAERTRSEPGVARLLALLAPAIRIEPALLRAARYLLPATDADVGTEAAVWNHPDIHATPLACYYDHTMIVGYRDQFKAITDTGVKREIAALIQVHHQHLSPAIHYEERLLLSDLLEDSVDPDAQQFSERVVKTLHEQKGALSESLQVWFGRLAARQHPTMWRNAALAAAWAITQFQEGRAPPLGFDLSQISWLIRQGQARRRYALRQRGQALFMETDMLVPSDSEPVTSGSPLGEIDAAAPWMQLRRNAADSVLVAEPIQPIDQAIPFEANRSLWLYTDHQELLIEPFSRPVWAHTLGRDGDGLFVGFRDGHGERRAYWWNPGRARWLYPDGRELGAVELEEGFFVDEPTFRAWRAQGLRVPAWADQAGVDRYGVFATFSVRGITQRVRWIPPGRFLMGSPKDEHDRFNDELQHEVLLTHGFWLAETACTQALWQAVMGDNPSYFKGDRRPVEQVSWNDVQDFIERLNGAVPGLAARLPTEAQWEYACRAGTNTPFSFGEDITPEEVNYNGEYPYRGDKQGLYRKETVEVASLPANPWGLYEMHGNVFEWCQDRYGDYSEGPTVDPTGPPTGGWRVLRGGSWFNNGRYARSAYRIPREPGLRAHSFGFRLALGPELWRDGQK